MNMTAQEIYPGVPETLQPHNRGMMVNVHVGKWDGFAFDEEETALYTANKNIGHRDARINKRLVDHKTCPEYAALNSAAASVKTEFYRLTLPYSDSGLRYLVNGLNEEFVVAIRRATAKVNSCLEDFEEVFPDMKEKRKKETASIFKEEDWPTFEYIRGRYYVRTEWKRIDVREIAFDPRNGLSPEAVKRLNEQSRAEAKIEASRSIKDCWVRLHKVVNEMATRLKEGSKVYDSYVENIRKLLDILPEMNFLNDPKLDDMMRKVQNQLLVSTDDLRGEENKKYKEQVANDAAKLAKSMEGMVLNDSFLDS